MLKLIRPHQYLDRLMPVLGQQHRVCFEIVALVTTQAQTTEDSYGDPDLALAKPFDAVPGYKGFWQSAKIASQFLPVIGKNFNKDFSLYDTHMEHYRKHGKIVRIDFFNVLKFALIYDPKDIQKVFRHEGPNPYRVMLHGMKYYRESLPKIYQTTGILIDNGKNWGNVRSNVQVPMLRPLVVDTYLPNMEKVASDFIQHMKRLRDDKQEVPQFLNEIYKWALESIGLVAFNTRLGCLDKNFSSNSETQLLINAANDSMDNVSKLEYGIHFWKYTPSSAYRKLKAAQDFFYSIAEKYFNKTFEEVMQNPQDTEKGGILGVYIRNGKLDRGEIMTFMLDLLLAGIDTTSHTMAFTLYLLARNPDKQEKACEEINSVLSSRDAKLSTKILNELPYMRACVKESLRLMSVVEGTQRILDHDIALSGYRIPAGVNIILLSQIACLLPENFEDPNKYIPERWLNKEFKSHPYANLPFGHGPRMCIGRRIAMQEIHLLLTKILQNFKVEYHYEDIQRVTRFVSMPDKPLKFSFVDRV